MTDIFKNKEIISKIDENGIITLSTDDVISFMLDGIDVDNVYLSDNTDIEQYNASSKEFSNDKAKIYKSITSDSRSLYDRSKVWYIPKEYTDIDVLDYLIQRCNNDQEVHRVIEELNEFVARDQIILVHLIIYLVDTMRKNGIVWGVGRGSSVASFVLYLIGLNKVNPLEYNIDHREFFK